MTMGNSIRVSEKHGVNPSVLHCPVCARSVGIALLGKLKDDAEAPRAMMDRQPCDECRKMMKDGIVFISVRDGEKGENPYRTGHLVCVKEEGVRRMLKNDTGLLDTVLQQRACFIEDSVWRQLGFPEGKHEHGDSAPASEAVRS